MKFLIAGFGSIGRRHFRNLLALGEKDILFYRSGKSELPDDELKGFVVEHDLEAALAHQPDAVIVANPTALHLDVAIPAAHLGCHILLEKPISHGVEGVDELQKAAEASGSRVLVGFQYRYHPTLQQAAQVLSAGELGRPLHARVVWGEYLPAWHPWEQDFRKGYSARADLGGGVVLTLSHPIDYLRWLLGDVAAVSAVLKNSGALGIEVEDQADLLLEFEADTLANLHLDYLRQPPQHSLEILCREGQLSWQADSGLLRLYRNETESWAEHAPPKGFERNDLFLAQTRHFMDVLNGEAEPACTLADGRRALEIALAAHQSSEAGRRVPLSK